MIDPVVSLSIQAGFALLFAFSAVEKAKAPGVFILQLEQYQLLPKSLLGVVGASIILLELGVATLLITPLYYGGVLFGALLLSVYAGAILINMRRGRVWMDCGCLGAGGEGLSYWLVVRNLTLLMILLVALIPSTGRQLLWLDYWSVTSTVVATAIGYLGLNILIAADVRSKIWWH